MSETEAARRLLQALEMFDDGVALQRERLRREHPGATEDEIQRLLSTWIQTRPGAEHGDAVGRPRPVRP